MLDVRNTNKQKKQKGSKRIIYDYIILYNKKCTIRLPDLKKRLGGGKLSSFVAM